MRYDLSRLADPERLRALDHTGLLDAAAEPAFDRMTRLASRILGAPVSLVSFVTPTRQFFMALQGLADPWASARETPLSHSFCQYVVASGEPLLVENAREHPLLHNNLAIDDLGVVAYLGVPVHAPGGHAVASLCTIDGQPRAWSDADLRALSDLAALVESEIELRIRRRELASGPDDPALPGLLQGTLDALGSRVAILDGRGIVLAINEAWRQSQGEDGSDRVPADDLGLDYVALCREVGGSPVSGPSLAEGIREVLDGNRDHFEHEYHRPGPPPRWFIARIFRFRGTGPGRAVVSHDEITPLKEAEHRLRESEEALAESRRLDSLGRLAGGIAHDFNNLLTAIHGNAGVLRELLKGADGAEEVQEIEEAAHRAGALTGQLLAFGRKQLLRPALLDPNAVIRDADRLLRRLIGSHIEVSTVLRPDLGRVQVDPGQLEQVLVNLALNARDALGDGGRLRITTTEETIPESAGAPDQEALPGRYVVLEVADTGSGIPAELLPRIFDPFFTTKGQGEGSGLGLATVYGIVRQSGGTIRVRSAAGEGSTFRVLLPRAADPVLPRLAPEPQAAPGPAAGGAVTPGAAGAGTLRSADEPRGTLLLAEDEAAVRRLAVTVLRRAGFEVLEAANGEEALRMLEARGSGVDVLVTDVIMPLMGGRELAARLRAEDPTLPVLFISGYTGETTRHPHEWIGAPPRDVALLSKPFTAQELQAAVEARLEVRRNPL